MCINCSEVPTSLTKSLHGKLLLELIHSFRSIHQAPTTSILLDSENKNRVGYSSWPQSCRPMRELPKGQSEA